MIRRSGFYFPENRIYLKKGPCIYCGDPRQEKEHWPPSNFHWKGFIFSVCNSCNKMAHAWEPLDLFARVDVVKNKLKNIRRKALRNNACPTVITDLERRYAWNAKEHLLECELGTSFVPQHVARRCLEESKKRNFKLLEEWFDGAWTKAADKEVYSRIGG